MNDAARIRIGILKGYEPCKLPLLYGVMGHAGIAPTFAGFQAAMLLTTSTSLGPRGFVAPVAEPVTEPSSRYFGSLVR